MAFHDDDLLRVFDDELPFEPQHTVVKETIITPVDGFQNHMWLMETQDNHWVVVHAIELPQSGEIANVDFCKAKNIFRAISFVETHSFASEPYKSFWAWYHVKLFDKVKAYHDEIRGI